MVLRDVPPVPLSSLFLQFAGPLPARTGIVELMVPEVAAGAMRILQSVIAFLAGVGDDVIAAAVASHVLEAHVVVVVVLVVVVGNDCTKRNLQVARMALHGTSPGNGPRGLMVLFRKRERVEQ